MTNSYKKLNEIYDKLQAKQLRKEIKNTYEMVANEQKRQDFKDKMIPITRKYQEKYNLQTNKRQGHEYWNNETDAFKHAYGSAEMYLDMGNLGSILGDIGHELETKNNPQDEWNMDSWNNNQGREIGKEIKEQYGKDFYKLSTEKQQDIIAEKVYQRLKNGQLIKTPIDDRVYRGQPEGIVNEIKKHVDKGNLTGQAAQIENSIPFTAEEIGKMTTEEFLKNESEINRQLQEGLISPSGLGVKNYADFVNPETGSDKIYTREEIGSLSPDDFKKNEKEIFAQMNSPIGIPTEGELKNAASSGGGVVFVNGYTRSDGVEVKSYYRSSPSN